MLEQLQERLDNQHQEYSKLCEDLSGRHDSLSQALDKECIGVRKVLEARFVELLEKEKETRANSHRQATQFSDAESRSWRAFEANTCSRLTELSGELSREFSEKMDAVKLALEEHFSQQLTTASASFEHGARQAEEHFSQQLSIASANFEHGMQQAEERAEKRTEKLRRMVQASPAKYATSRRNRASQPTEEAVASVRSDLHSLPQQFAIQDCQELVACPTWCGLRTETDSPPISPAQWNAHTKAVLEAKLKDVTGDFKEELRAVQSHLDVQNCRHQELEARLSRERSDREAFEHSLRDAIGELWKRVGYT
jgi:hypothetical protein